VEYIYKGENEEMTKYIAIAVLTLGACGPQYIDDPNARVLVTSQYEDEPPRIIYPDLNSNDCKPQLDCTGKSGADCAAALYNASEVFMKEGEKLELKKLYLSATVEYMQALTRLTEAEIRLDKAKTDNYEDWKVAVVLGLEKKIKERIKICQQKMRLLKWRRH
jgi:hypothetical protein